ncbi:MAG: beta-lactamase family protein [Bdellovibrionales bacterium]|nr:beta-lactamase family protein [Bdellovibrionales bacterium]
MQQELKQQHFDSIAVGVLNFSQHTFETFVISPYHQPLFFDLASLTKPLTLGISYLVMPELFGEKERLLLNHQAGLPSWSRLPSSGWQQQILDYPVAPSTTNYSDLSALRLMLELEKNNDGNFISLVKKYWDQDLYYPDLLPPNINCPPTGMRGGKVVCGEVNDDNAWRIGRPCVHAGLFATIDALCKTLLLIDQKLNLLATIKDEMERSTDRFIGGWDRVENPEKSHYTRGASNSTFGHLGFTGTSIWIDIEKRVGHVILSNATQNYSYDRNALNHLRCKISGAIFN